MVSVRETLHAFARSGARGALAAAAAAAVASAGPVLAAPPPEVTGVQFAGKTALNWSAAAGASDYNVYRGTAADLARGIPPRCHADEVVATTNPEPSSPAPGQAYVYLVTGESNVDGEGTSGVDSSGAARATLGKCDPVMRHHLLDRITFGWNEWVRDRLNVLGPQAFLNEQLNPSTISEADNGDLNLRMSTLTPPADNLELVQRQVVQAVYARRQLEQIITVFWANHFSTDYVQVFDTFGDAGRVAELQMRELENFRKRAFTGTFRQILEDSALSPAMIVYLDTDQNVAGRPQENYGRELMELHTMGVDGGYTQEDVRQMALVFTGWNTCRKIPSQEKDPLAPCQLFGGRYVAHFDYTKHDCRQKVLFAGTPQETVIPATCNGLGQPTTAGVNDFYLALDAVADHPSTPRFIGKKLLQLLVTETPTPSMIDAVVATWESSGGNLKQIYSAVLSAANAFNPDFVSNKIKTPFEQFVSVYRATRADTDDFNLLSVYLYLQRMQMLPHLKPEPTGYSEVGKDWINTNDMLERQNFAWDVAVGTLFRQDIIPLLAANGLSAASPPGSIVDFYSNVLFGGALTPAERARAIGILTTDDNGNPAPVDNARIQQTVAYMMGTPQFFEQ